MTKSQPAKVLLDTSKSGIDKLQPNQLMTIEIVQMDETIKAVLVAVQPLGLNQPPVGNDRIAALAREIVRRALYQLLPFSERENWKDERHGIVARALEFEGMTQADLMRASPEDMVGRFLDMTRRRRGNADTELLKQKIEQLLREYRSNGNN